MAGKTRLFTLLGDYPNTLALKRGEIRSDLVELEFADIKVANTGFKPLVREAKFDLGELAIVTYLQAKAYGKPYILLPAPVVRAVSITLASIARRHPGPADLIGKRVGVRAYSVTTGVWVPAFCRSSSGRYRQGTLGDVRGPPFAEYEIPRRPSAHRRARTWCRVLIDGELDPARSSEPSSPIPGWRCSFRISRGRTSLGREARRAITTLAVIRTELSARDPIWCAPKHSPMLAESRDVAARPPWRQVLRAELTSASKPTGVRSTTHHDMRSPEAHSPEMAGRGVFERRHTGLALGAVEGEGRCHGAECRRDALAHGESLRTAAYFGGNSISCDVVLAGGRSDANSIC